MRGIEVKVPDNIRDIHETVAFGLSLKEVLCGAAIMAISILAYISITPYCGLYIAMACIIILCTPIALFGIVRWRGQPGYKVLFYLVSYIQMPTNLTFHSESPDRAKLIRNTSKKKGKR